MPPATANSESNRMEKGVSTIKGRPTGSDIVRGESTQRKTVTTADLASYLKISRIAISAANLAAIALFMFFMNASDKDDYEKLVKKTKRMNAFYVALLSISALVSSLSIAVTYYQKAFFFLLSLLFDATMALALFVTTMFFHKWLFGEYPARLRKEFDDDSKHYSEVEMGSTFAIASLCITLFVSLMYLVTAFINHRARLALRSRH